jgi:hypothetical protein
VSHVGAGVGQEKGRQCGFVISWSLRTKALLEPRDSIWFVLAVWVQRRHSQEGQSGPGVPRVGSWIHLRIALGHSKATPKEPGVSYCEPASGRVTPAGPWCHWLRNQRPGGLPITRVQCPPHPNVARCPGGGARGLHCPVDM